LFAERSARGMNDNRINPDWVKKQKRRILWADLFMAGAAIFFITMGGGFYYLVRKVMSVSPGYDFTQLSLTSRLLFIGCCFVFPIVMVITSYYYHRKQKSIMQLVPEHEGRVCPKCLLVMKDTDNTGLLRCVKCKAEWPDEELVKYWEQFVLPMRESAMWLAEKQQEFSVHKSKRWFIRLSEIQAFAKRRPILWMCLFAAIIIPIDMVFTYRIAGDWYSVISHTITILPYIFAFALIGRGMKQRRGKEAHCASCNYLKPPTGSEDIPRCPECGHAWNEFGGTAYGAVSSKPWMFIAGILLFIIPMIMPLVRTSATFSSIYAKAMPTSFLIPYVSGYGHFVDAEAWNEINNRSLTSDEYNQLARRLLDSRYKSNRGFPLDSKTWLDAQITKRTIEPALIDRFFNENIELHLNGPEHAITGQPVRFDLHDTYRFGTSGYGVAIMLDHVSQDDHFIKSLSGISDQWVDSGFFDTHLPDEPQQFVLTFKTPGKHTIYLTAWLAGIPGSFYVYPIKVARNPDGSPVIPAKAVWSKKVELVRTILVSDE